MQDTLFLYIINVLDYSILVGVDEENMELVVGN
jgi:1-phosphatidylinositol-3-phosphate 5-kinase